MPSLPPLNPLRAFEATGRLSSIKKAADELGVTADAVSRQIHILEKHLGVRLFHRQARTLNLTSDGHMYLLDITVHFEGLRVATRKLVGRRGESHLRIRAYTVFGLKWLSPRLSIFLHRNPSADVRVTTSLDPVDFALEDIDAAIVLGDGHWPGLQQDRLAANDLIAACSASYHAKQGLIDPKRLCESVLMHASVRLDDWRVLLDAMKIDLADPYAGPKYDSSILAFRAAIDGFGVVATPRVLIEDDLSAGRLVQVGDYGIDRGSFTYYLIFPQDRLRNPVFRNFRKWLVESSTASFQEINMEAYRCANEKSETNGDDQTS
jgi:LysR family glycine cleavage system transcriptional activator